jgi:hypothetical protein
MVRRVLGAFGLVTLLSGSACLSTIDGSWCGGNGEQLSIKGPKITLPSHIELNGEHHLHAFQYRPLENLTDSQYMVYMHLEDNNQMSLYHVKNGDPGTPETWMRCEVTS